MGCALHPMCDGEQLEPLGVWGAHLMFHNYIKQNFPPLYTRTLLYFIINFCAILVSIRDRHTSSMPPKSSSKTPSASAKVKPPLDLQRAQELNSQVLKRKDPEIDEVCGQVVVVHCILFQSTRAVPTVQILGTFGHVVLYDFNKQTKGWVREAGGTWVVHGWYTG